HGCLRKALAKGAEGQGWFSFWIIKLSSERRGGRVLTAAVSSPEHDRSFSGKMLRPPLNLSQVGNAGPPQLTFYVVFSFLAYVNNTIDIIYTFIIIFSLFII
ncbi:MAG: hypothetical protein LBJ64_05650, partial [Deltaproteobacteria bacterium]|nr:hypothetical protein [Deltaproteobacteria bacterium]